ncbi:hypothetical protein [Cupriavidus sp. UGS-1]|uniref:hypothetical protein n=1 Tax=Cupriavidus sp. UGS-1 TaxID=2899826 RepID=UPI001E4F419C|nr:hypothetical protein [Cupriavidus sp. UGS-1]MCD9124012.1 hypothetical protein [Cupriavidus sp. UGS-1]
MNPAIDISKRAIALHTAALAFLAAYDGEEPQAGQPPLLQRCAEHLVDTFLVSLDTAMSAATIALGERTAAPSGYYIDCDLTTSYVLHLVNARTRRRHVITVAELIDHLPD